MRRIVLSLFLLPLLGGCVASAIAGAAVSVVTLPVKVASAGVDAVTTSQSEADENRGRKARKADERAGKEAKKAEKARKEAEKEQARRVRDAERRARRDD